MEIKSLELKNIKFMASLSEETHCYSATVYVNGKAAIEVQNDGHGASDMQHVISGDRSVLDAVNEYCKKTGTATVFLYGDVTAETYKQKDILYSNLETWCGDKIQEYLTRKEIARLTKTKVAFWVGTDLYTIPVKKHPVADIIKHVHTKYPGARVLNEMSVQEQIEALSPIRRNRIEISYETAQKVPA